MEEYYFDGPATLDRLHMILSGMRKQFPENALISIENIRGGETIRIFVSDPSNWETVNVGHH